MRPQCSLCLRGELGVDNTHHKTTETPRTQRQQEEFEKIKLPLAAVEALAFVKSNQRERARELTQKFKDTDRVEGQAKRLLENLPRRLRRLDQLERTHAKLTDQS